MGTVGSWTGREAALLRRALRLSIRDFARHLGVSDRMISKWEAAGTDIEPRPVNASALDVLLERADDAERARFAAALRGTIDDAQYPEVDPVKRQEFLRLAVGATAGAWIAQRFPGHDGSDLVGSIAGPTAHYRRAEQAVPTGRLAPAVEAHLALAEGIVREAIPTRAGYAALSEANGLAAWLAADQGDTGTARRHYIAAVRHVERAGHSALTAYMRASLGHHAVECGDARHGVTLLHQARLALDGVATDAARAWLAALLATAHAVIGDQVAAHAELRTSEQLAEHDGGEPSWPWVFAFDGAKSARYRAAALGALGDLAGARDAYAEASPALTAPKARALAQVGHARALAHAGHVAEGCELATDALTVGRQYGSERVTQRVRDFRASLPHHTTAATGLDDAIAELYAEGTS